MISIIQGGLFSVCHSYFKLRIAALFKRIERGLLLLSFYRIKKKKWTLGEVKNPSTPRLVNRGAGFSCVWLESSCLQSFAYFVLPFIKM